MPMILLILKKGFLWLFSYEEILSGKIIWKEEIFIRQKKDGKQEK